jgi:CheY-like chemotaxis protein
MRPCRLDLNGVLSGLDGMLRRLVGADIELTTLTPDGIWTVEADRNQIEQVVMNLVVNARDAMPSGGRLTLETRNVALDEAYTSLHHGVPAGDYTMLAVSDSGVGMDAATQERIFEPFFTTKADGKGTGLGLSTVFGIVKQSGGHIWVYSEPNVGTTVKVYLPRTLSTSVESAPPPPSPVSLRGHETLLLVEDDARVRAVGRSTLERAGYTVLEAHDAAEAIFLFERSAAPVDLLLTDVVLPRMGGRQLADLLRGRQVGLKVLFMSGYTPDVVVLHGVLRKGAGYLEKPFTPDTLTRKVREVIEA